MKPTASLLAAALVLALAACNNQDPANDATGLSVDTTATEQGVDHEGRGVETGDEPAVLPEGDRRALRSVAELDRHLVDAAETALAKNVSGDVRAFAETVRDTHRRTLVATRNLLDSGVPGSYAATAGDTAAVTGSAETDTPRGDASGALAPRDERPDANAEAEADLPLTAESRALRERYAAARSRVSALDGAAFTRAWLTSIVDDHEAALEELDGTLISAATDEDVARHLQQTRATLAEHLETARALQAAR